MDRNATIRAHLTQNVVGYLALFVALGGTSYAFATGSIDSREIKDDAVRSKDLKNNTVRSKDVRDLSLQVKDFKPGELLEAPATAAGTHPAPSPGSVVVERQIETKGPSRLFVLTRAEVSLRCFSGLCHEDFGLYVDDNPVGRSGNRLGPTTPPGLDREELTVFGITSTLAAGTHSIKLTRMTSGDAFGGLYESQLAAFAVGG